MCQEFDLALDNPDLPQIAFGFAGGLGNTGAVCGAVAGAVLAISLKQGRAETVETGLNRLAVPREFRRRFEAERGTISCRELTGIDLTTEAGLQQSKSSNTIQEVCFPAVAAAYRIVADLLRETT